MKPYILLLLLFAGTLTAQVGNRYSVELVAKVKSSTLYVVEDDKVNGAHTPYNLALHSAFKKYWDFCAADFISAKDMAEFLPAEGYSMFVKTFMESKDRRGYTVDGKCKLNVFLCNLDSVQYYTVQDQIVQFGLPDFDTLEQTIYKIPLIVRAIQHYFNFVLENKVSTANFDAKIKQYFTQNKKRLKSYTLYLCREEVPSDFNLDRIRKVYPHKIEILERKKLKTLIANEEENAAVIHFEPYLRRYWIWDMGTGEVIYSDVLEQKGKLSAKDFKRMK